MSEYILEISEDARHKRAGAQITGTAVLRAGLKNGSGTIFADTVCRTASTVISMLSVVPTTEFSRFTQASAIIFLSVGDHVVDVALPTTRPPRYTGTAVREAMLGTCGAMPTLSYSDSTSFQLISSPTRARSGPFFASRASASRPTKVSFFKSTSLPSPISAGENFCASINAFLLEV